MKTLLVLAPHPELAEVYGEIRKNETPLARVARYRRLAAQNPSARETHLALAEAALVAELWGEARRHLERALAADPPPFAALPVNSGAGPLPSPMIDGQGDSLSRTTPRMCLISATVALVRAEIADRYSI